AGLLVGQQGGAADGRGEDISVEGDLDVLVRGDDVLVGGEGALDEGGGEDGAGVRGVVAEGEDRAAGGDGHVDGLLRLVGELEEHGQGLGGDDAAGGVALGLGGGGAFGQAPSVGRDHLQLLAVADEQHTVDGVAAVLAGGGEEGAGDQAREGAGGGGEDGL